MSLSQQILNALEAASSPSQDVRQQGETLLAQLKADPLAFFSSCAEILVSPTANAYGRQLCGFQIKNALLHPACAGNATLQQYVCTQAITDPLRGIRKVASSIISLAARENVWSVEVVVPSLCGILAQRGGELPAVHGAIRALSQVVDDCILLIEARRMIPAILQTTQPFLAATHLGVEVDAVEVRAKALDIVASFLERAGMDFDGYAHLSLREAVLPLIQVFFGNLERPLSNTIATKCITCLVLSLTFHEGIDDALFGRMLRLIQEAMGAPEGPEEQLRIAATEFWRGVLHFPRFAELAEPAIEKLIPVLIRAMVYSDMEMSMLQANPSDWNVPDKLDDIRPRQYQARVQNTNPDDDDDDQGDEDEIEEWNLRRVAALTLDNISEYFGDRVLMPVLVEIDRMMQPQEPWKHIEAAVLALGAICDGCFDALAPYLPSISDRLLELLESSETHFLVVNIALWTGTQVGRYLAQEPGRLTRFMRAVLRQMQSPSKLTQESATSALATMSELCTEGQLDPMIEEIVLCIAQCARGFQLKNCVLLFETLKTFCECAGDALRGNAAALEPLMALLGEVWASTANDSPLILSFFESMASVCRVLGPVMQPMAGEIFRRAYGMLAHHTQLRLAAPEEAPEPEFLITAADLLSGLFDALGASLEPLLSAQQPTFMQVVLPLLMDEQHEIRQSGFALLGDVARACPTQVQAALDAVCGAARANLEVLNESTSSIISNVAWALCNLLEKELDINHLPTLAASSALPQLYLSLAQLFSGPDISAEMRNMAENVALCLGMMLYADPDLGLNVSFPIDSIAKRFCEYVRNIKPLPHRTIAVNGFLLAVQRQGGRVVVGNLKLFFDLAYALTTEMADTQRAIKQLLTQVKEREPAVWQRALNLCDQPTRMKLYEIYGIN
ncbi:unnamed protein product [Phytomonas sp. EM1]|nr:unnamed protein product [Phytomonas sp. EM1]|eukprot:CCW62080.1 unnamed protein product [Phytomonas sp. isolate EM1]